MTSFGLLGYGKLGKCLASRWIDLGLEFNLCSRFSSSAAPDGLKALNFEKFVKASQIIFLATPPSSIQEIRKQIGCLSKTNQLISLAAGVSLDSMTDEITPFFGRLMTSTFARRGMAINFIAGNFLAAR